MKSLIQFIWKNNFLILFILLEIIAISLIIRNNNFQRASFINSSNAISGAVYSKKSNISDYINLKTENQKLAKENALLRQKINAFNNLATDSFSTFFDSLRTQQFNYTPAKVINLSTHFNDNFFTLNKGTNDGVLQDMAVTSTNGIVGIIKNVSSNYSSGISLLHTGMSITAKIKHSNYFGSLIWNRKYGRNNMLLKDVPEHVKLTLGDSIITSGHSTIFPEGLPIGTIQSFENDETGSFHLINVKLFTDFRKLQNVYVIANLKRKEQIELEQTSQKQENGE